MLARLVREAVADARAQGAEAVLLSGGLDSSSVAVHVRDLPAFTGYYEGEPYDERRYARLLGASPHHEVLIEPHDFVDSFDAMLAAVEPPYAGPGMLGQFVVAKAVAAEGISCVMSGEGGDELFGGYARLMIVAGEEPPEGYENYSLPEGYPHRLEEALAHDYAALANLVRVDEAIAAAHGVSVRAPLLSPSIVAYAEGLDPRRRVGKAELREAMRGVVPAAILDRKDKRGFPVPFVAWAQEEPVRSFVRDRIGYVPDPRQPWARGWWNDLCEASQ